MCRISNSTASGGQKSNLGKYELASGGGRISGKTRGRARVRREVESQENAGLRHGGGMSGGPREMQGLALGASPESWGNGIVMIMMDKNGDESKTTDQRSAPSPRQSYQFQGGLGEIFPASSGGKRQGRGGHCHVCSLHFPI